MAICMFYIYFFHLYSLLTSIPGFTLIMGTRWVWFGGSDENGGPNDARHVVWALSTFGWAAMRRTCPNDVFCVVWALGTFFIYVFHLYL